MNQNKKYISRCLELAKLGIGNISPNPMVGSVIVFNNKIIGEGYHRKYGEAHAEVNAINSVKDLSLLKKATLFVNLEPCSHYGKTPPCAELIIRNNIPKVVIGALDPNPKVAGNGSKLLKEAGVEVIENILEKECKELNVRFYTYFEKKRPYIILKWAQTRNGFIDIIRDDNTIDRPTWITNELSRRIVHKWRAEEDSILVGTNTALKDNPSLNIRDWNGKNPLRLVLDRNLRLPDKLSLFNQEIPTVVYTKKDKKGKKNIEYSKIDFNKDPELQILNDLYCRKICSVIIEGGASTLRSFISKNLWDEARVFIGNQNFNDGIKAPKILSHIISEEKLEESKLLIYKN